MIVRARAPYRLGMGQITPSTPNLPSGCSPIASSPGLCNTALYGPTSCNEVRECDPVTGALHFQYSLPGTTAPTPNADILTVSPITGLVQSYNGPTGVVAPSSPVAIGTPIINPSTGGIIYTPPTPASGVVAAQGPAQSNATNSTPVGPSGPAQSNAVPSGSTTITPSTTGSSSCFALFGSEPCLGPIGMYTLLAGAAALFGGMALFGRHR